jgi:hypothetical protein
VFRRNKTEEPTTTPTASTKVKDGGKGRPTPTRKEAEAAARARARAAIDKKAGRKAMRQRRAEQNAKMREGLRTGDERYLPARDQGKPKRFVRDFVDSRLCMAEFLMPLLLVVMISQGFSPRFSNGLWSATILLVLVDTAVMIWRLKRQLRTRFPDESHKGTTSYAVLRALQIRFLRLPKPQVKLGRRLPDRY